MKVSIITACYNRQATIAAAIESVLAQDYPNIEYIVIDGASKDNSLSVINNYKDKIATIISEPDKGMYEAINKGLRLASGDIIGLVHSDDFLFAPNTVSKIVTEFKKKNADLVYGNGIFVDFDNTEKVVRNWVSGKYFSSKVKRGWLPLHPTVYVTKELLNKCGLYNESYRIAADTDWLIRMLLKLCPKVVYLNECIIRMRMGGLSTDPQKMKQKWIEDLSIYRIHNIRPYWALGYKIASKIPQFISARFSKERKIKPLLLNQ